MVGKIKKAINFVRNNKLDICSISIKLDRGLIVENGIYKFIDVSKKNDSQKVLRGLWLNIENLPGKNGFRMYLHFQFPVGMTIHGDRADELLKNYDSTKLRGKFLYRYIKEGDVDNIEDVIKNVENLILAILYMFTK